MSDIDEIIARVKSVYSDLTVRRLEVSHPGVDDDGVWFFERATRTFEVQLESSSGNCPFLIESSAHDQRLHANTIDEAVGILRTELERRAGR